jgi:hypothetical protein
MKADERMNTQHLIPSFDLQSHHDRIEVPTDFDLKDLSKKYSVFPLKVITVQGRSRLLLAMRNPHDLEALHDVEFRSGVPVIAVQASEGDIQWLMQVHYFGRKLTPPASEINPDMYYDDVFEQLTIIRDLNNGSRR